jgi:hypothetical protein
MNNQNKYFNEDFMSKVKLMSDSEMKELLLGLEGTQFWIAIVRYSHERMTMAQNGLFTLDPFKDQTQMARYQGILTGIVDLQDAVITLKEESEKRGSKK